MWNKNSQSSKTQSLTLSLFFENSFGGKQNLFFGRAQVYWGMFSRPWPETCLWRHIYSQKHAHKNTKNTMNVNKQNGRGWCQWAYSLGEVWDKCGLVLLKVTMYVHIALNFVYLPFRHLERLSTTDSKPWFGFGRNSDVTPANRSHENAQPMNKAETCFWSRSRKHAPVYV